jgi:hypothetical protein
MPDSAFDYEQLAEVAEEMGAVPFLHSLQLVLAEMIINGLPRDVAGETFERIRARLGIELNQ